MAYKPLTSLRISTHNLKYKYFRTICLSALAAVLAFVLFAGSVLSGSLDNGMLSVEKRLGADIMVVPKGYESKIEGALLRGEKTTFYFNEQVLDDVLKTEGVAQASPQLFIESLSAECCTVPIQLIGFDPGTDFTVNPWITENISRELGYGEIVIGQNVDGEVGGVLKFFDTEYKVAGRLKKTATGFDTSVFMNMDTARDMIEDAGKRNYYFLIKDANAISSVMVKVEDGYSIDSVAEKLKSIDGVDVAVSKSMFTETARSLNGLTVYIRLISAALWVLAVIVLTVVFSVTVNERKKEFAVIRILGATRKKLFGIVLWESSLASLAGSVSGIIISALTVFPFSTYIGLKLKMPYLRPDMGELLIIALSSLAVSFVTGPLASLYSAVKISRVQTYITMREGE